MKERSHEDIGKEHMWIVSKGRQLFETINQWKVNLGPGKYHPNKKSKPQVNSGWGKNVRFNYDKTEKKNDLGPASYALGHTLLNKKPVAASVFNSKSTKSHIEDIVR
jgi:hypothetical protein